MSRGNLARVTALLLIGTSVAAPLSLASGSGTSLRLAFVHGSERGGGLYTIGFDGRGLRQIVSGNVEAPAWSPNGRRLAYTRMLEGGRRYEIYMVAANGTAPHAITHGGGFAQSPTWAPDGSRIVFSASGGSFGDSTDPSCAPNLWVMRPDGTGLHRLLRAGVEAAFSPDGRRIAFVRPDARDRPWLYLADSSGRRVQRLGLGAHPSWSPDGRRLVVERGVGLNRVADLWIVRVSDGRATRLTGTASLSESGPAWSPNGTWIAFSMVRGGRQDIYAMRATGGGSPRAITHTSSGGGDYEPAWLPVKFAKATRGG